MEYDPDEAKTEAERASEEDWQQAVDAAARGDWEALGLDPPREGTDTTPEPKFEPATVDDFLSHS